jgi:hypothetical protein
MAATLLRAVSLGHSGAEIGLATVFMDCVTSRAT